MNIIAAGMVGEHVLKKGGIGIGPDVGVLIGLYRSVAAGTFKPATITDAQIGSVSRIINVLAMLVADPAGEADVVALVKSL